MPVAQKKKRVWPLLNDDDTDDEPYDMETKDTLVARRRKLKHMKNIQERLYKPSKKHNKKTGLVKKSRPQSAPSRATKTAKEMWMEAVKDRRTYGLSADGKPRTPRAVTPVEYWINTLRTTGEGISTESTGMQLTGRPKSEYAYLSTPKYLRQMMGADNQKSPSDQQVRVGGAPVYKSPEDYYDENLDLRKKNSAYDAENLTLKVKLRSFERELNNKDRQISKLQKQGTSGEISAGDKNVESSNLVISLKQKITRLESEIRKKELAHAKLASDIKTTKIDELRLQMETFYQEVMRLQNTKASKKSGILSKGNSKESDATIASLKDNIMRINKEKENLQKENLLLKDELTDTGYFKQDIKRDYEDMNRKQMLATIVKLEKRLKLAEKRGSLDDDKSSVYSLDMSGRSSRDFSGKIELEGSIQERLDQLDKRETHLLDEIKRLRGIIKRLKEDKKYFKKKSDSKEKDLKDVKRGYYTHDDLDESYSSRTKRQSRNESASSRSSSPKGARMQSKLGTALKRIKSEDPLQYRRLKDFVHNRAAKRIQKGWKSHHEMSDNEVKLLRDRAIKSFILNRAARRIQHGWKDYKIDEVKLLRDRAIKSFMLNRAARKIQHEWKDHKTGEASFLIQSVMFGNDARRKRLNQLRRLPYQSDSDFTDEESDLSYGRESPHSAKSMDTRNAMDLVRNSLFGHRAREKRIKSIRKKLHSDDDDSEENVLDSEDDSDTDQQYRLSARSDKSYRPYSSRSVGSKRRLSSLEHNSTTDKTSRPRGSVFDLDSSFDRQSHRRFSRASSKSSLIEKPSSSRAYYSDDRQSSHRNSLIEKSSSSRSNRPRSGSYTTGW